MSEYALGRMRHCPRPNNVKRWFKVSEKKPYEGIAIMILDRHGYLDSDCWDPEVAYYCDGEFYQLEYDDVLRVLRKKRVNDNVEYWASVWYPPMDEIKESDQVS